MEGKESTRSNSHRPGDHGREYDQIGHCRLRAGEEAPQEGNNVREAISWVLSYAVWVGLLKENESK